MGPIVEHPAVGGSLSIHFIFTLKQLLFEVISLSLVMVSIVQLIK